MAAQLIASHTAAMECYRRAMIGEQSFEGRREDVIALYDDIAKVKADPEHDGFVLGLVAIGLDHGLLELYRRCERIHGASELDQAPVALHPDYPPAAAYGSWRKPLVQMFQKPRNGAALVPAHQPRRSNRVCKKDCRQFALLSRQRHSPWIVTESVGVLG